MPLLPPGKKRCPDTFLADTGASLEHPSLPPGCCQRVLAWDKSLLPSSGPGAGPGAHRAGGCSGSPAGSPRGPWGHGSRSRHRLAPPGLGCPPHTWPQSSAEVGVFWCFFIFLLSFFGKCTWLAAPGRAGCVCASPRVVFPAGGWFFPKLGISGLRFVIIIGMGSLSRNAPQLDFRCIRNQSRFKLIFLVKCTFKKPGAPPDGMAKREVVTLCRSWGPEKQDEFREWGNTCKGNGSGTDRRPSPHEGS